MPKKTSLLHRYLPYIKQGILVQASLTYNQFFARLGRLPLLKSYFAKHSLYHLYDLKEIYCAFSILYLLIKRLASFLLLISLEFCAVLFAFSIQQGESRFSFSSFFDFILKAPQYLSQASRSPEQISPIIIAFFLFFHVLIRPINHHQLFEGDALSTYLIRFLRFPTRGYLLFRQLAYSVRKLCFYIGLLLFYKLSGLAHLSAWQTLAFLFLPVLVDLFFEGLQLGYRDKSLQYPRAFIFSAKVATALRVLGIVYFAVSALLGIFWLMEGKVAVPPSVLPWMLGIFLLLTPWSLYELCKRRDHRALYRQFQQEQQAAMAQLKAAQDGRGEEQSATKQMSLEGNLGSFWQRHKSNKSHALNLGKKNEEGSAPIEEQADEAEQAVLATVPGQVAKAKAPAKKLSAQMDWPESLESRSQAEAVQDLPCDPYAFLEAKLQLRHRKFLRRKMLLEWGLLLGQNVLLLAAVIATYFFSWKLFDSGPSMGARLGLGLIFLYFGQAVGRANVCVIQRFHYWTCDHPLMSFAFYHAPNGIRGLRTARWKGQLRLRRLSFALILCASLLGALLMWHEGPWLFLLGFVLYLLVYGGMYLFELYLNREIYFLLGSPNQTANRTIDVLRSLPFTAAFITLGVLSKRPDLYGPVISALLLMPNLILALVLWLWRKKKGYREFRRAAGDTTDEVKA